MDKERAAFQQRTGEFDPAACLTKKVSFIREADVHTEILLLVDIADDRIGEMMHIDHEIRNPGILEL